MNNEKWYYKIDGKFNGIVQIVIFLVLSIVFTVLTVDQLQPSPNKYLFVAVSFGSIAAVCLYTLAHVSSRYFWFKVYIGEKGFYFQSNPFNGKYYEYADIKRCKEELKTSRSRHGGISYYYFFTFTDRSGKQSKFLLDKALCEREINELKKRIERE